jgi:hypothetical protein
MSAAKRGKRISFRAARKSISPIAAPQIYVPEKQFPSCQLHVNLLSYSERVTNVSRRRRSPMQTHVENVQHNADKIEKYDFSHPAHDALASERVYGLKTLQEAMAGAGNKLPSDFPDASNLLGNITGNKNEVTNKVQGHNPGPKSEGYDPGNKVNGYDPGDKTIGHIPESDFQIHRGEPALAAERLNSLINASLSAPDKAALTDLNNAVLTGDTKAFADVIANYKDDPKGLNRIVGALNDNLFKAGTGVAVATDGSTVTIMGRTDKAIQFSTDGNVSVRQLELLPGGTVSIGEVVKKEIPDKLMNAVGAMAVKHMLGEQQQQPIPKTPAFKNETPTP